MGKDSILIVADPLGRLNPAGDSSLVLAHTAMARGYAVSWVTEADVRYACGEVKVNASECQPFELGQLPRINTAVDQTINNFKAVWIRRDPPFDTNYIRLCWILAIAEEKVWMMNAPSLLVRYHEKILQLEAHAQGFLSDDDLIATHIGSWSWAKKEIRKQDWKRVVTKPFLGYGGNQVNRWDTANLDSSISPDFSDDQITQPYIDEVVKSGDRRVFLIDGKVSGHFARIPKTGNFVSNLAQGGHAELSPLAPREKQVLGRLGKFLKKKGIFLAGADVIDGKISEVNITSPTGFMNLINLESKNYADDVITAMEEKLTS